MNPVGKSVSFFQPVSKTNGATAAGYIDRLGYDYLLANVDASSPDVVSNKPSVLKLSHSDITDATGFSDISGFVGGTDFTVANGLTTTTVANTYQFGVDLIGKKRYIKVSVSPVTTQVLAANGFLFKGKQTPDTASEAGVLNLVTG